ncbi:MAG: efflux RND transporter periplasmic adaptor subunit [Magnetococcales bacterium]|nr:efflux RND transporter periplasmic adaptor subunit [Magnetococcales bacterium]
MAAKALRMVWLMVLLALGACSQEAGKKAAPAVPPVAVSVVRVERKNLPVTIQAMGNAESCHGVAIRSQVEGALLAAHISDGQEVKQGALLFELDDRLYRHRLEQLKANLERDLAQLENARSRERRQVVLSKEKIGSEEVLASLVAGRRAAEATVAADRAASAEGELQLAFTRIVSPITGMAGRILIQPGNLVKANDANPLVVINQMDPMCVTFTVAEHHLRAIQENQARSPLTLQLYPDREVEHPIPATLHSLDNTVDRQTSTLRLKARAANPDRRLWPGMFVTLSLKLAERPDALVIPVQAIQTGSKGPFVYVVKQAEQTVESRPVAVAQEDKEQAVIASGLADQEMVVTVGQWRLKPGAKVEIIPPREKP